MTYFQKNAHSIIRTFRRGSDITQRHCEAHYFATTPFSFNKFQSFNNKVRVTFKRRDMCICMVDI